MLRSSPAYRYCTVIPKCVHWRSEWRGWHHTQTPAVSVSVSVAVAGDLCIPLSAFSAYSGQQHSSMTDDSMYVYLVFDPVYPTKWKETKTNFITERKTRRSCGISMWHYFWWIILWLTAAVEIEQSTKKKVSQKTDQLRLVAAVLVLKFGPPLID